MGLAWNICAPLGTLSTFFFNPVFQVSTAKNEINLFNNHILIVAPVTLRQQVRWRLPRNSCSYFSWKHMLWVRIRSPLARHFLRVPTTYVSMEKYLPDTPSYLDLCSIIQFISGSIGWNQKFPTRALSHWCLTTTHDVSDGWKPNGCL